jgi:hypothetical protein
MGLLRDLVTAMNREYDRRIKRASLITEYGVAHHHHGDADHGHTDAVHKDAEHMDGEEQAEIVNVPRGTPVNQPEPPSDEPGEATQSKE